MPAIIAFALLVHADSLSVMQLLESIYRPHHYYVLHVDLQKDNIREELIDLIEERFGSANVIVLPKSRSFETSWGSFGLVRALLETYEELCRFGPWDFAINLSGSDLPLRSITDLSFALAPHRYRQIITQIISSMHPYLETNPSCPSLAWASEMPPFKPIMIPWVACS